MSQQQESQHPTSEPSTELQPQGTHEIVVSYPDEDLIFGNNPSHSQVSDTEFSSLISEVFCSDPRETSAGISCGNPNCPCTHTQSEFDLVSHVNSGRISLTRRSRPSIRLMTPGLALLMLASMVERSNSQEESAENPEEGSNVDNAEESKSDPTDVTWAGSSTSTLETPGESKRGSPVV